MHKENFFIKNKSILSFLILEVIALLTFNFVNISIVFEFVGILLAVVGVILLVLLTENKKELLYLLIPVLLLLVVSGIASFNGYAGWFKKWSFSNITLFLAIPSFFILGIVLRKLNDTKPTSIVLVIGAALAAITLFSLFSTVIGYGFFYTARFKNTPYYYYTGTVYDVTEEMYWLSGFEFKEISIKYGSLFALLSACYLPGLLFVSYKENRNQFLATLAIGSIGLITLIVVLNVPALIVLLLAVICALIIRFLFGNKKVTQIVKIGSFVLIGFALLFFALALLNAGIGYKFPGILNRIFVQNDIMIKVNPVFDSLFENGGGNLFGLQNLFSNETTFNLDSNVFEVQLLKEVGLFGTIVFIGFLVFMVVALFKYLNESDDSKFTKSIFVGLIVSFFVYESFANTIMPLTHEDYIESFLRSPLIYIMLFIFGYIYSTRKGKEI